MDRVEKIEAAIEQLSSVEFERLSAWIEERVQDRWDQQLEADAASGRLDDLYRKLRTESGGQEDEVSLDEFLDDKKLS